MLPLWLGTADGRYSIEVDDLTLTGRVLRFELGGSSNGIAMLYAELLAARLNIASGVIGASITDTLSEIDVFLAANSYQRWNSLNRDQRYQVVDWIETLEAFNSTLCGGG